MGEDGEGGNQEKEEKKTYSGSESESESEKGDSRYGEMDREGRVGGGWRG